MNKTQLAILARCAESAAKGTDFAGRREAKAARQLESSGVGRVIRGSIAIEWKQNGRRVFTPVGRFVCENF